MISRSPFEGFGQVIYPLFFATVAFFVFRAGDGPSDPRLRLARRGGDGHVVGDEHDCRRRHAAGALARDARAARRGSSPLCARPPAGHAGDGDDRDLQPGRDAALRPLPVRDRPGGGASAPVRRFGRRHRALVRRARLRLRGHVRPLPSRLGARQPLRVPRLADRRLPRAARPAPALGAPDLVGARADLGHERDPRVRRGRLAAGRPGRSASGSAPSTSSSASSRRSACCTAARVRAALSLS